MREDLPLAVDFPNVRCWTTRAAGRQPSTVTVAPSSAICYNMIMQRSAKLRRITIIVISFFLSLFAFSSFSALAYADDNPCDSDLPSEVLAAAGCNEGENTGEAVPNLVVNILNTIIAVAGLVAVIYIVVGGFKYTSSKGEPDKIAAGKRTILYAMIGLGVSVLAFAIVNFTIGIINESTEENASNFGGSTSSDSSYVSGSTIDIGETVNLSNLLTNAQRKLKLTWSSSDPSVATVDSSGKLDPKKAGTATITATDQDGKVILTKTITVSPPVLAKSITISPSELTLKKGGKQTLTAKISPTKATNRTVTWSSSNKKIATVNANGTVKGIKNGTAKITAKTDNGKKDTIKVTVGAESSGSIEITQDLLDRLKKYHQTNYGNDYISCDRDGSVGNHSCGISAYIAGVHALTGAKIDYIDFVKEGCTTGFYDDLAHYEHVISNGSGGKAHEFYEKKYGVKLTQKSPSWDNVVKALKKGQVVINYVVSPPSMFTGGEHFVTSLAYRKKNGVEEIYVWNPNTNPERSKGNCDTGGCWYTKSEYIQNALTDTHQNANGAHPGMFILSKVK